MYSSVWCTCVQYIHILFGVNHAYCFHSNVYYAYPFQYKSLSSIYIYIYIVMLTASVCLSFLQYAHKWRSIFPSWMTHTSLCLYVYPFCLECLLSMCITHTRFSYTYYHCLILSLSLLFPLSSIRVYVYFSCMPIIIDSRYAHSPCLLSYN